MAINKKGSRLITVDNQQYCWNIRKKPTYNKAVSGRKMTCAVESVASSACVLVITFPWMRLDYWVYPSGNNCAMPVTPPPVTPKLVETCIREALKQGWQPNVKGTAFNLLLKDTDETP